MKAVQFVSADAPCQLNDIEKPKPGAKEVVIEIKSSALNRRDYWIKKGIYKGASFPCIPGSDASGIVIETGSEVSDAMLNASVIINPAINWGFHSEHHSENFEILGLPRQGTLSQYIAVPEENVYPKPNQWSFEKASSLPLAGLTAYRALFTRGQVKSGDKVLITGAGGGVSTFLLNFAVAAGADVYVTSSSEKKIKKSTALGAKEGFFYTEEGWENKIQDITHGGVDLIIDSAAGKSFEKLFSCLKTGGKIVIFGGTTGQITDLTAAKIFWKQASILGTTMGSPDDFKNMLKYVDEKNIEPVIDKIFPMEDAELAFSYMENQEQFGKIVIKIADIPYI